MFLLTGQVVSNASCMALLSDGRAWAAVEKCELGLDEIGLIVLVSMLLARMWPCQRNRRGQERRVERSVQVGRVARLPRRVPKTGRVQRVCVEEHLKR